MGPYTVEITASAKGAGAGEVKQMEKNISTVKKAIQGLAQNAQLAMGQRVSGTKRKSTHGGGKRRHTRKHRSSKKRMTRRK